MDAPNLSRTLMRIERGTSALGADTETTRLDPLTCRVRLLQLRIPGFALVITLDEWHQKGRRVVRWEK